MRQAFAPRPITGRWGTASVAEATLLSSGEAELPSIFFHALIDGRRGRRSASETVDVDGADEDYSERRSRWLREAYAELIKPSFWRSMKIAHYTRKPCDRLRFWLQEHIIKIDADRSKLPSIVTFVCETASSIMRDWEELLSDAAATTTAEPYHHTFLS